MVLRTTIAFGIDRKVAENDIVDFGGTKARVIEVAGHTSGHVAYHFEEEGMVFVGDIFARLRELFEGTPQQCGLVCKS